MAARFRIRTSQGQEVSFASHQGFEEFVRSGDLAPDDLVYDAETGEWAPARTHPLVLEIGYADEEAASGVAYTHGTERDVSGTREPSEASRTDPGREPDPAGGEGAASDEADPSASGMDGQAAEGDASPTRGLSLVDGGAETTRSAGEADAGAGEGPDGSEGVEGSEGREGSEGWASVGGASEFGLDLAPTLDAVSPQEASKRFVERMESERARDIELGDTAPVQGIRMEGASALADIASSDPDAGREPGRGTETEPVGDWGDASEPWLRTGPEPPPAPDEAPGKGPRPGAGRRVALLVVVLVSVGVVGYFGGVWLTGVDPLASRAAPDPDAPEVEPAPVEPPPPPPVIAATIEAVRERARERFLSSTQAALAGLDPIPTTWLTGEYLSLPSEHPGVRAVWQEYRTTVLRIRGQDDERYRTAYGRALDDAGVRTGPDRAARLQAGMDAFRGRIADLDGHWNRVEALAVAAIQSHDALLEAEGLILFDPSLSTGRPAGIGAGTSGRSTDSQLLLDQVIDLVDKSLDADGLGPREGTNVREWVWGGFLDVMSR